MGHLRLHRSRDGSPEAFAAPHRPRQVPLVGGIPRQMKDRQIYHTQTEFGYREFFIGLWMEKGRGKWRERERGKKK